MTSQKVTRKRIQAAFKKTSLGNEPVRDWLIELSKEYPVAIGSDIKTVEFGWPFGRPTCRPKGNGLYEIRTDLGKKNIV